MKVSEFVYKEAAEDDRIATSVLKGVFRFVSGLIAKRRARSMEVSLPVVTIGIRGTNVGGEVDGERATVVLLEPESPGAGPGRSRSPTSTAASPSTRRASARRSPMPTARPRRRAGCACAR